MDAFFSSELLFSEETLNAIHLYAGPFMDHFMKAVTSLGGHWFFYLALPLLYWCVDTRTAVKIGAVFFVSAIVNTLAKDLFANPRPDPEKLAQPIRDLFLIYSPRSPGFPSGHTQGTVAFWGAAMAFTRNKGVLIAGALLFVLVPYSRLYLGVHFPGDVLGGYFFGALCLLVMLPAVYRCEHKQFPSHDSIALLVTAAPWAVYAAYPQRFLFMNLSLFAGLAAGLIMARERISFNAQNGAAAQVIKGAIGFGGLAAIVFGLNVSGNNPGMLFFQNWVSGFWVTFIAPLLFSRISRLKGAE